jgi:integrase
VLDADTIADLREHRRRQLAARLRAGSAWQNHDLVFCHADGSPVPPHHLNRRWNELVEESGLPRITPYGARHTAATIMLIRGVPPKVVSTILGHANVGTTLGLYGHVLDEHYRSAAEVVGSLRRRQA